MRRFVFLLVYDDNYKRKVPIIVKRNQLDDNKIKLSIKRNIERLTVLNFVRYKVSRCYQVYARVHHTFILYGLHMTI